MIKTETKSTIDYLESLGDIKEDKRDSQVLELERVATRKESALAKEIEEKNKKRYKYADAFMKISVSWLVFVACATAASGIHYIKFSLSDAVLLSLIGTSIVNVLAPAVLLAKYLFPNQ